MVPIFSFGTQFMIKYLLTVPKELESYWGKGGGCI